MKRILLIIIAAVVTLSIAEAKPLKAWKEGTLDIHHISTGRGSSIFFILPDGTRMLVDAGDLGDPSRWKHKEIMPAVPNGPFWTPPFATRTWLLSLNKNKQTAPLDAVPLLHIWAFS